ncbi:hypothetical protein [Leptolyngbya sp. FACHB-17]|uniref:hypothetical protein n=1 Tax=unclassified Leptolyngbya TaxID=2650499 RepID=UPI001680E8B5|nr:hypothetical protein [Leptolyngbya sp. FACHB-17]MBD2081082.1 hypothetical protein [Leptolyngbya sp. FACHB-17]
MRIQLDRKLTIRPKKLLCTIRNTPFEMGKIRLLLYTDRGLLLGDISPECLKLSSAEIRSRLRERGCALLQDDDITPNDSIRERALELLQAAQEDVKFPTTLDWWFKKFEIFSEESQELEATRTGLSDYYLMERSRLQKILDDDRD